MTATIPTWDLSDRLAKSMRTADVGTSEMAEYLGVSRNTITNWTLGHVRPGLATVRAWAQRTGVEFDWLLGDGEGVRRQGLEPRTRWLMPDGAASDYWWSTRGLVSAA